MTWHALWQDDELTINGESIKKPFLEKPISGEASSLPLGRARSICDLVIASMSLDTDKVPPSLTFLTHSRWPLQPHY